MMESLFDTIAGLKTCNFITKETATQVFSCDEIKLGVLISQRFSLNRLYTDKLINSCAKVSFFCKFTKFFKEYLRIAHPEKVFCANRITRIIYSRMVIFK